MKYLLIITLMLTIFTCSHADETTQPTLVFGTTEAYVPFAALDSAGAVYGFSVSFSRMLCKEMEVRCIYKPMVFKDFFSALSEHKIDAAIGAIAITKERQEKFAFTLPYLISQASNIAKIIPGQKPLKKVTLQLAQNKIFGIQTKSIFADKFAEHYPNLRSKSYNSVVEMIEALQKGEVDFIILDTPVANYWVNTEVASQFYIVGKPFNVHSGIGIMLNKDNPKLLAKLNQAIMKVTQSNDYRRLLQTFFPLAN